MQVILAERLSLLCFTRITIVVPHFYQSSFVWRFREGGGYPLKPFKTPRPKTPADPQVFVEESAYDSFRVGRQGIEYRMLPS